MLREALPEQEGCDIVSGQRVGHCGIWPLRECAIEGEASTGARRGKIIVLHADGVHAVLQRVAAVDPVDVHFGIQLVDVAAARRVAAAQALRVAGAHRDSGE
jgi:hypothetical protein